MWQCKSMTPGTVPRLYEINEVSTAVLMSSNGCISYWQHQGCNIRDLISSLPVPFLLVVITPSAHQDVTVY